MYRIWNVPSKMQNWVTRNTADKIWQNSYFRRHCNNAVLKVLSSLSRNMSQMWCEGILVILYKSSFWRAIIMKDKSHHFHLPMSSEGKQYTMRCNISVIDIWKTVITRLFRVVGSSFWKYHGLSNHIPHAYYIMLQCNRMLPENPE